MPVGTKLGLLMSNDETPSSGEAVFQCLELVFHLPLLLLCDCALLDGVLDPLLQVFDGLLLFLLRKSLLDIDLVASTIVDDLWALVSLLGLGGGVNRFTLNAQVTLVHDPLLSVHSI